MNILGFLKHNKNKRITIEAWIFCMYYRMIVFSIPMKYLEKKFGVRDEESSAEGTKRDYYWAVRVSKEVNRIADKTPWDSKCLVRALTAQRILKRRDVATTLYLGVGTDDNKKMIAHAWLRCGSFYVTGGTGEGYAMVAKFKM
ncbi:MAG: lasso peptide biosynthesis B2 protein [Lachnospiraceae bacterium]|nr:lasso peptide biosynthesis B2 protein [Lachnospiraceae bacterium]